MFAFIKEKGVVIDGKQAFIESVDKEEVVIRVHWLPYWCPNSSLAQEMGKYGQVRRVVHEMIDTSDEDTVHIASSVRKVFLSCQGG